MPGSLQPQSAREWQPDDVAPVGRGHHCLDLAKVQTQQGRLFFLILAVGCEWRVLVAQVTCGCRVLVAAVTQPTWQEITRHRLGSGAQLEKLKLNF